MKLNHVLLDLIVLTPEQLAMERLRGNLPLVAVLVLAVVVAVTLIVRKLRK